jgi:hypothetical protein
MGQGRIQDFCPAERAMHHQKKGHTRHFYYGENFGFVQ